MNQTIRQQRNLLDVARQQLRVATADFYQKISTPVPGQALRFSVVPKGANTFEIVDRHTGVIRGPRFGHINACDYAKQLERKTCAIGSTASAAKVLGKNMLRFAMVAGAIMVLFAWYGAKQ